MKRGLLVTCVLLSFFLVVIGEGFADDHDGGGTLRISKAEWDQAKQKLKVKATEGNGRHTLTAHYGGTDYQMEYKKDKNRYELNVKPVCYAPILTVDSTSGASAAKSVKVKNGDGTGFACTDNGGGSTGGGSSGGGGSTGGGNTSPSRDIVVIATNDLGMHCTCPTAETFVVLPPFNTLRAQVFERKGENPDVLSDPSDIRVEYRIVENTDASLKNDPYFKGWIEFGPKLFPGSQFLGNDGRIHGLTGATLSGKMEAKKGWWEVTGVPAFPALDPNGVENDPIDPVNGAKRNPYLTAVVDVYDQNSNELLASTSTVVPVAFGGCCNCHLQVAKDHGRPGTPRDSFEVMGQLHQQNGSGIDISKIDPDGDGIGGPIRCSQCHLDPAMGETTPPGIPGYKTSDKTFSEVVHKFHAESSAVAKYDPDIAKNCYQCHPGNGVNCFRGQHKTKGLWCTDCHGDLNQRIARNQLKKPWSAETLPKCEDCHYNTAEGSGYQHVFGGSFLNSMGHEGKVLCSTCHGTPHGLSPSTLAKENDQNQRLQGDPRAIGKCDVCHNGKSNIWMVPPHKGTPGYSGGGSGGGTGGTIDVATELATTCLKCHGDRRSKVNCNNSKWLGHDGSKVSSAVFAAVSTSLTGSNCGGTGGSGGGGTGGGTGGTIDVNNELATTCLTCHGDKSNKVNCSKSKWLAHDGSRVSNAVFVAVSTALTGSDCGSTGGSGGGTGGGTGGSIDVNNELATTCLQCHGDKSNKVSCSKSKWLAHDGSRVSNAVFVAVSTALTGSDCGSTGGSGGGNYGEDDD